MKLSKMGSYRAILASFMYLVSVHACTKFRMYNGLHFFVIFSFYISLKYII